MDASFVDLDILLTKIRLPQSRTYFLDAVKAYKAGALRAALTAAWVALAFDLIAKYRELSAMGDAGAAAFLQSWDKATAADDTKKLLELERSIIDHATVTTQVINPIARTHLDRLRKDRHLCAHPAFSAEAALFEPTPELVRLHLVNAIDLVLAQEARQGQAILDVFSTDVLSLGFPTDHARILDYVEQRYLTRVRPVNVRNFGVVLAKSLLKGLPPEWEPEHRKIISSLVAVRDRAPDTWPDLLITIVRLLDTIEPANRVRAIAFIAAFPDVWPQLEEATRTALQATVDNTTAATLTDFRILEGLSIPHFRAPLEAAIAGLDREQLTEAIAASPRLEFWPRAVQRYRDSGSWRGSEENFRRFISPFAGAVTADQAGQLLDAITDNPQNWDAGETSALLLAFLRNTAVVSLPAADARDRLFHLLHRHRREAGYADVLNVLRADGWAPAPPPPEDAE